MSPRPFSPPSFSSPFAAPLSLSPSSLATCLCLHHPAAFPRITTRYASLGSLGSLLALRTNAQHPHPPCTCPHRSALTKHNCFCRRPCTALWLLSARPQAPNVSCLQGPLVVPWLCMDTIQAPSSWRQYKPAAWHYRVKPCHSRGCLFPYVASGAGAFATVGGVTH